MPTVVYQEPYRIAEYLVSEAEGYRSREQGIITGGVDLQPGTVLGKITASGKYTLLAPGAADGSQTAAAILYQGVRGSEGDVARALSVRDCEVNGWCLQWPAGATNPQKTAAIAQLAAQGVIVRF